MMSNKSNYGLVMVSYYGNVISKFCNYTKLNYRALIRKSVSILRPIALHGIWRLSQNAQVYSRNKASRLFVFPSFVDHISNYKLCVHQQWLSDYRGNINMASCHRYTL